MDSFFLEVLVVIHIRLIRTAATLGIRLNLTPSLRILWHQRLTIARIIDTRRQHTHVRRILLTINEGCDILLPHICDAATLIRVLRVSERVAVSGTALEVRRRDVERRHSEVSWLLELGGAGAFNFYPRNFYPRLKSRR